MQRDSRAACARLNSHPCASPGLGEDRQGGGRSMKPGAWRRFSYLRRQADGYRDARVHGPRPDQGATRPTRHDCGTSTGFEVTPVSRPTEGQEPMTETSLDELGPVDYVVVEFPAGASNFTGEMVKELLALVSAGTIRVIDILILTKDDDGAVEPTELSDVGELGELQALEAQLAELLAEEDVEHLAAAMEPGTTAGVLIWENLWAAPFAAAARRSGGQLIANGRIPIQAIIASIEADVALAEGG
ncbi:MAG TPA: DUF6325 family protein [Trebonia sp.]|nr:DUF6325 family protein [Trebonia sp.]